MSILAEYKKNADAKIAGLAAKQEEWTTLGAAAKAVLLGEILTTMKAIQSDLPLLADQAVLSMGYESAEGDDATMPWCLEQLIHVQNVTTWCKRFKGTLEALDKTGDYSTTQSHDFVVLSRCFGVCLENLSVNICPPLTRRHISGSAADAVIGLCLHTILSLTQCPCTPYERDSILTILCS